MAPIQLQAFSVNLKSLIQRCCCCWNGAAASAAAIVFTTTNVVVASMPAAEVAAATPAAAASLYQSFQLETKGLKLNGGHFVHDNFKHLAPNPDA